MSATEQDPIYRIVERAAEIIKDPEHWTQGAYARTEPDRYGDRAEITSKEACCFCMEGAIRRAAYELALSDYTPATIAFGDLVVRGRGLLDNMVIYNDIEGRSHDDVLSLLGAIKRARSEELADG